MVGEAPVPAWLQTDGLLAQFARRRADARRRYGEFVLAGKKVESHWRALRQQIYLGDAKFVERMQRKAKPEGDALSIPRAQRRAPAPSLAVIAAKHRARDDAIVAAYGTGAYSYRAIAEYFGLHLATVGRIIRARMLQCETPHARCHDVAMTPVMLHMGDTTAFAIVNAGTIVPAAAMQGYALGWQTQRYQAQMMQ